MVGRIEEIQNSLKGFIPSAATETVAIVATGASG